MKKRRFQILISVLIVLALLSPVFVFGYTKEDECKAALLQEGDFDIESTDLSQYKPLLRSASTVDAVMYEGFLACSSEINLRTFNIPIDDISAVYSEVLNNHPDLFFVDSAFRISYVNATRTVASVYPTYKMTPEEAAAALEIFYGGADEVMAQVDNSMNDLQKALTVHDYMISIADYPTIFDENGTYVPALDLEIYHSAYGFFLNHRVVCQGFTLAYQYIMNTLGVPCVYVASDAMNHAWNLIQIGGAWYNVDLTFDNHDYDTEENTNGSVMHAYFLKSDTFFSSDSGIEWHYGGVPDNGEAATSTLYDSAFWDDVTARIYTVNGDFYYLDPGPSNSTYVYFRKRTLAGSETLMCSGFTTTVINYSSGFYDENGTAHYYSFKDRLARLAYLDGRFYVGANKKITSVLPDGSTYQICTLSANPKGLAVNESANLIYHLNNDNNALHELDKYQYFKDHITAEKGVNYNNYPDMNLDNVINGKDAAQILKQINN